MKKQFYINTELPIIKETKTVSVDSVVVPLILAFKPIKKESVMGSKLIGKWTNSKYSHVELIIGNKWVSSTIEHGVHIKELTPLKNEYDYVVLDSAVLTASEYHNFMTWLYKQDGKGYDRTGIVFANFFPLRFDNRDKWYCSELVVKCLQLLSVPHMFDVYPFLSSPGLVARLFGVEGND